MSSRRSAVALFLACGLATAAHAQVARHKRVIAPQFPRDSGMVTNRGPGPATVYTTTVFSPGASSVRVHFGDVRLAGDPETERASYLLITSLADGAYQRLGAAQLGQWRNSSAYFNGDAVRIDLIAWPGTGENRLVIDRVWSAAGAGGDSICGPGDDRAIASDSRVARLLTSTGSVCTAFLISDSARCMLGAGQCAPDGGALVEFNVPPSTASGDMVHPDPRDQYAIDEFSIQSGASGPGNDWAYFGVFPNSNTDLGAAAAQGGAFPVLPAPPAAAQTLRLNGFGTVSAPVPANRNRVQKSASGAFVGLVGSTLEHQADTTTGDAGSPIQLGATGQVIGIHNGDGCVDPLGSSFNTGTAVQNAGLQAALAAPAGLCASTFGPPEPPLYFAGDAAHGLSTVSRRDASFGRVNTNSINGQVLGLAYDRGRSRFYASEFVNGGPDVLHTVDRVTGDAVALGIVNGPADVSGLAFDPNSDTLYGIDQGSGQLYRIDFNTGAATPAGAQVNPNVGAIDFDPASNTLFGLDDGAGTGTKLIKINPLTGARVVVGALGDGITDCDGLAFCGDDRQLYTINQPGRQLVRIDPNTGAGTVIGTAGPFGGSGHGLACGSDCAPACAANGPVPPDDAQQQSIGTNVSWLGCPNQKIFGVDSNPTMGINQLDDIVTGSGGATVIGPTTPGSSQITGMAWGGQAMYAIDLATGALLTLNTQTGTPTTAGLTGLTGWQALASDVQDNGQLYGITQANKLYRISNTGSATLVTGSNVGSLITALEFDRTGQLWGIEFASGKVYRINKLNGAVSLAATTIAGFQGLDFDDTGTAYGHNSSTDSLYTINLATGVATLRGASGTDSVKSIAFGYSTDYAPPGGDSAAGPVRRVFDPTNLTETTPVVIDPDLVIDHEHHGLRPGSVAVQGVEYPRDLAPRVPEPPPAPPGDAACGGTTINFDDLGAPCALSLATRLTVQYAARGVVFEGAGGSDGGAVLDQCAGFGVSGISGSNFLAFNPGAVLADGGIAQAPEELRFTTPVSSVQISVASAAPGMFTMQAYRAGTLIATRSVPLTPTMTPVSILGGGITRVVLLCGTAFAADNLCFVQSCPTTYDVYLGTDNPPTTLIASDTVNTTLDPGSLASTTVYYWRVVAKNCCGRTPGPVWRFTTICYPNCDASTTLPFLNVNDFVCFLQRYASGDTYANCDDSTSPPILNINDFICFQTKFAAGCPR